MHLTRTNKYGARFIRLSLRHPHTQYSPRKMKRSGAIYLNRAPIAWLPGDMGHPCMCEQNGRLMRLPSDGQRAWNPVGPDTFEALTHEIATYSDSVSIYGGRAWNPVEPRRSLLLIPLRLWPIKQRHIQIISLYMSLFGLRLDQKWKNKSTHGY
jgi:hypothetical protein